MNLLEEAVKYIRNKNKNISWSVDDSLTYKVNDESYFYEEPFWKLIANGDGLDIIIHKIINYEQLLQLINGVQLAGIHFSVFYYENDEKIIAMFEIIEEVSRARVTYRR